MRENADGEMRDNSHLISNILAFIASQRCLATNQLSLSLVIFRHQVALSDMYPASSHCVLFKSKRNEKC